MWSCSKWVTLCGTFRTKEKRKGYRGKRNTNCGYRGSNPYWHARYIEKGRCVCYWKEEKDQRYIQEESNYALILEEQVLPGVEEEETPLMKVERNNPREHVVCEEHVEGCIFSLLNNKRKEKIYSRKRKGVEESSLAPLGMGWALKMTPNKMMGDFFWKQRTSKCICVYGSIHIFLLGCFIMKFIFQNMNIINKYACRLADSGIV